MSSADCKETDLGNGCHYVESNHSTFTYIFQNGVRVTTNGTVQVSFDGLNKIENLSINTIGWSEYIPRHILQPPESPDQKQDLKINKNLKRSQTKVAPSTAPLSVPNSSVAEYGLPPYMVQFLEVNLLDLVFLTPLSL